MRRLKYLAVVCVLAVNVGAANATTFDWSYSGPGISGNGTLDGNNIGGEAYLVDSITGTADGQSITGILPIQPACPPDNCDLIFYPGAVYPTNPTQHVNTFGLPLILADGSIITLYGDHALDLHVSSANPSDVELITLSVSQTPLPAALPLFAGGAGLIGLLARRRKRKAALAA